MFNPSLVGDDCYSPISRMASCHGKISISPSVLATGPVTATNSVFGTTDWDQVGGNGVASLSNGNYVVVSEAWSCPAGSHSSCPTLVTYAGAVTWSDGMVGITGPVTPSNSLIGTTDYDAVGDSGVASLSNGNYFVKSKYWSSISTSIGAVTFGKGLGGLSGSISSANSLVGSIANDRIGNSTATATSDGKLIFRSQFYNGNMGLVIKIPGDDGIAGSL